MVQSWARKESLLQCKLGRGKWCLKVNTHPWKLSPKWRFRRWYSLFKGGGFRVLCYIISWGNTAKKNMEFWRWWFTKGIHIQFSSWAETFKKKMHQESLRATLSMVLCRRGFLEESFTRFLDEFLFLLKKSAKKNWCSKTIWLFFSPAQPKACALKTVSFWEGFRWNFQWWWVFRKCWWLWRRWSWHHFFLHWLKKEKLTGSNCLKGLQPDKWFSDVQI